MLLVAEDGLATITLNRPDQLNTLTFEMIRGLVAAFERCEQDDGVRAILLRAAGDRAFCAGYDLKGMGEPFESPSRDALLRFQQRIEHVERAIMRIRKPVTVAVQGHAIGPGLDLVLCSDYSIAASDARLSESRVLRGNMGTVHWLPLYVGWAKAKDMLYRGAVVDGVEAERIGLVNRVVPVERLQEEALSVAREFAHAATQSLGMLKYALNRSIAHHVDEGIEHRNLLAGLLRDTADRTEGARAFLEKRGSNFVGH